MEAWYEFVKGPKPDFIWSSEYGNKEVIKKQFLEADEIVKELPIIMQMHPGHMHTSKSINTLRYSNQSWILSYKNLLLMTYIFLIMTCNFYLMWRYSDEHYFGKGKKKNGLKLAKPVDKIILLSLIQ
jgi:hypothetical protein